MRNGRAPPNDSNMSEEPHLRKEWLKKPISVLLVTEH